LAKNPGGNSGKFSEKNVDHRIQWAKWEAERRSLEDSAFPGRAEPGNERSSPGDSPAK
jgi:hypothetical protein